MKAKFCSIPKISMGLEESCSTSVALTLVMPISMRDGLLMVCHKEWDVKSLKMGPFMLAPSDSVSKMEKARKPSKRKVKLKTSKFHKKANLHSESFAKKHAEASYSIFCCDS